MVYDVKGGGKKTPQKKGTPGATGRNHVRGTFSPLYRKTPDMNLTVCLQNLTKTVRCPANSAPKLARHLLRNHRNLIVNWPRSNCYRRIVLMREKRRQQRERSGQIYVHIWPDPAHACPPTGHTLIIYHSQVSNAIRGST